jgi:SAM-dependent methyltransferase
MYVGMIDIQSYSNSLRFREGIWYTSICHEDRVSYPSAGNKLCFDIEDNSFWFSNRNRIICEVIKKYSIVGPLFDVGGGNGFVSDYLTKSGFETVLIEPGIDGCINGRARGLNYVINSYLDTDHFLPDKMPNIGIFDVLEHINDTEEFLNTLQKLLIHDGRLYITVPAFSNLWSAEDNYAGHYNRYNTKELEKILSKHKFEVLYSTYFFSFLYLPVFILRTIPTKIGFYNLDLNKSKNQHLSNATTRKILSIMINFELNKIRRGKSIRFGSSLLIVARKK